MRAFVSVVLLSACAGGPSRPPIDAIAAMDGLMSADPAERERIVAGAGALDERGVLGVGLLLDDRDPQIATAARRALWRKVHEASGAARDRSRTSLSLIALLGRARVEAYPMPLRDPALSSAARAEILRMLALTVDDAEQVHGLAPFLDDAEVRSAAVFAFERIAHPEAERVLIEKLRASTEPPPSWFAALGARRSRAAVEALLGFAEGGAPAADARRALARIGDPRAQAVLAAAFRDGADGADDDWLRFLESPALAREVKVREYRALLDAPAARVRVAALEGLERLDAPDRFAVLRTALEDREPLVQDTAERALATLSGADVGAELAAAVPAAAPALRAQLLRVLAARNDPRAPELAIAAANASDAGVRAAAADGLLLLARQRVAGGAPATALPLLASIVDRPDLADAIAGVRLAAAERLGDAETARGILHEILAGARSRETRKRAARALVARGEDPGSVARAGGFLTRWHLLGPLQRPDGAQLGVQPFGVEGPDLAAAFPVRGKPARWREVAIADPDGVVDLVALFQPNTDAAAFACTELERPAAGDATLKIGSDDGVAVWLNGELVHHNPADRGVTIDQDIVKVRLRAGRNRILVAISQGGGDWGFCVRVADANGAPIDLR